MNVVERYSTAVKTLPRGHYDIDKAKQAMATEYEQCRIVTAKLEKKFKKVMSNIGYYLDNLQEWADRLNNAVGIKSCKVFIKSPKCTYAAGLYCNREIHMCNDDRETFLHELAHHWQYHGGTRNIGGGHGETFCTMLEMVYDTFAELFSVRSD